LPAIEDLFIHTYKIMPQHLKEQMEELKAFLKEREK
jgi:hypothetical protein